MAPRWRAIPPRPDQDADPHAPVGTLDARAPEIRRSREPDAQQSGRDERHRRPRRRRRRPRLTRPAGRRQEHPEAGDDHQARSERGFRDPFIVASGRCVRTRAARQARGGPRRGECRRPTPARRGPGPPRAPTAATSRGRPRRRRSRRASSDRRVGVAAPTRAQSPEPIRAATAKASRDRAPGQLPPDARP